LQKKKIEKGGKMGKEKNNPNDRIQKKAKGSDAGGEVPLSKTFSCIGGGGSGDTHAGGWETGVVWCMT